MAAPLPLFATHGARLALAHRFVRLMGGEVRLPSEPGKGSTFTVSLPLRYGERPVDA